LHDEYLALQRFILNFFKNYVAGKFIFVSGHQTVQSCAFSRAAAFAAVYHQSRSARNQVHSTAPKGFLAIITFTKDGTDAEFGGVRFN
jgi:hypothetical protein